MTLGSREQYIATIIMNLRARGWGFYRIGRKLWPYLPPRTAQMRAYRLYKKYIKLLKSESPTGNNNYNDSTRRPSRVPEDDAIEALRKIGRTQKLVLYALKMLGGRARFMSIVLEVAELLGIHDGRGILKKRVWAALRRLYERGLIGSYNGVYWLARPIGRSRVMVENFRVDTSRGSLVVWAKSRRGGPADLDDALILATLWGARRTVQVELAGSLTREFSAYMGENGISIIKIYRDPRPPYNGRAKIEVSYDRPPNLYPSIVERDNWIRSFLETVHRLVRALLHGGLVGGLSWGVGGGLGW